MKFITYCFNSILLAALAISLPANGMFRSAALARTNTFKQHPSSALQRIPKASKSTVMPPFTQKEKKQEYSSNKQQFKKDYFEFDSLNTKSGWTAAGIAAGLTAWGLYFTNESEKKHDEEYEQIIKRIDASYRLEADFIEACFDSTVSEKSIDNIVLEFVKNHNSGKVEDAIKKIDAKTFSIIYKSILRNFKKILDISPNVYLLDYILKRLVEDQKNNNILNSLKLSHIDRFIPLVQKNIATIIHKIDSAPFILRMMEYSKGRPKNHNWLTIIDKKLVNIIESVEGHRLINALLNDSYYEAVTLQMLSKKNHPAFLTDTILKKTNCSQKFEKLILENSDNSFDSYIKTLMLIETCNKDLSLIDRKGIGPTKRHLLDNKKLAVGDAGSMVFKYLQKQELMNLSESVIAKEHDLNNQGFYTLIHGQRKEVYFPAKLYTILWEVSQQTKISDYTFPWIKKPILDQKGLLEESEKREKLLTTHIPNHRGDQQETLYLNYGLWTNLIDIGESSAYYTLTNFNFLQRHNRLDIKQIFDYFNCDYIYRQFSDEIESLASEYKDASTYGNILLFGVPKEKINKVVYNARPYGKHIKDKSCNEKFEQLINTMSKETDLTLNVDLFCMPMTFDMALNPNSGIKIFPFITGNVDKLKELKAKEDALFEKIKKAAFKKTEEYAKIKDTRKAVRDLLSTVQN